MPCYPETSKSLPLHASAETLHWAAEHRAFGRLKQKAELYETP